MSVLVEGKLPPQKVPGAKPLRCVALQRFQGPPPQGLSSQRSRDPMVEPATTSWWFQPHLKNISQIGSFPQVRVKIKNR